MRARPKLTENRFDQWADDIKAWISESVSPFEDDTPVKKTARVQRAEKDLLYFCSTYLPHYFTADFGDFHHEWESLTLLHDEVVLVGAPREHAKSTFFTFAVPIRNVCYQSRMFQLIVSDTNDQATGFTLAIRVEMESNPRLKHDFGDLSRGAGRRSVSWKKNDFTAANGVRVLARGHGEKVRGLKNRQYRPDFAVIDDFENDENVENPAQVKKGLKWLKRAVIGSMGRGFLFMMVGNLFSPQSVLSKLIAEKDEQGKRLYLSRVYDCWIDYGKPAQRPLWPALWPTSRLVEKQRLMGTVDFNAEMRNLTGAENSPFREEHIVYYDRDELTGRAMRCATGSDPSGKSGEANDYKAIVTVALDETEMIFYVTHAWIRKASVGAFFDAAYRQHDQYPGMMGIEENMFEDFLHEVIQNEAQKRTRFLPWYPVRHQTNKEARIIGTLSYLVEYGRLRFERGHSDQDRLVEQLVYLLNKNVNDDGPDALETAVGLLQKFGGFVWGTADPEVAPRAVRDLAATPAPATPDGDPDNPKKTLRPARMGGRSMRQLRMYGHN